MATGDYLCFLNAGDTFFSADSVEQLMGTLMKHRHRYTIRRDRHRGRCRSLPPHAAVESTGKSWMEELPTRDGGMSQAFIVKRELFEPYDLDYRFSSDFDWSIRMMKKAKTIHNSRLTLINYLNEGMTTRNRGFAERTLSHHGTPLRSVLHLCSPSLVHCQGHW